MTGEDNQKHCNTNILACSAIKSDTAEPDLQAKGNKDKHEISSWLKKTLEKNYNVKNFDDGTTFFEMGMDSVNIIRFVGDIEEKFACSLPHNILWQHNNIQKLSDFFSQSESQ